LQVPGGLTDFSALLALANARQWKTFQIGNYSPYTALMTIPPSGFVTGMYARSDPVRLWLHASLVSQFAGVLSLSFPGFQISPRAGPVLSAQQAHQLGLAFVQVVGDTLRPEEGIALHIASAPDVVFPRMDGASKDAAYLRPDSLLHRWPP
jgi:hypothetical protein